MLNQNNILYIILSRSRICKQNLILLVSCPLFSQVYLFRRHFSCYFEQFEVSSLLVIHILIFKLQLAMSSSSTPEEPSGASPTPEPGPSSSSGGGGKAKSAKKPTYESLKKLTIAQLKVSDVSDSSTLKFAFKMPKNLGSRSQFGDL